MAGFRKTAVHRAILLSSRILWKLKFPSMEMSKDVLSVFGKGKQIFQHFQWNEGFEDFYLVVIKIIYLGYICRVVYYFI